MSEIQFPILIVGIFSIVSSYFLTYLVHNLTKDKKIIIKRFVEKRLSDKDIPPFGGLAMSITFLISVRLLGEASPEIKIISLGCVAIALVGLFDDLFNLSCLICLEAPKSQTLTPTHPFLRVREAGLVGSLSLAHRFRPVSNPDLCSAALKFNDWPCQW